MNNKYKKFMDKKNEDWQHYSEITVKRIKKPITILLGPNGTGKSMSLRSIQNELVKSNTRYVVYSTSKDDIVQKGAPAFGDWDVSKLAMAFSSEGERMTSSFLDWSSHEMLKAIFEDQKSPLWVLVDEADSGLSIDRLLLTLSQFITVVTGEYDRGRDIHALLTCNSWVMLEIFLLKSIRHYVDVIWVPTKESILPSDYINFKGLYLEYFDEIFRKDLMNVYDGDKE